MLVPQHGEQNVHVQAHAMIFSGIFIFAQNLFPHLHTFM